MSLDKILEVQRFLDGCEYDFDAIKYNSEGGIEDVRYRTAKEVEKTKMCTCLDGVFYAISKLKNNYGSLIVSLAPVIEFLVEDPKSGRDIVYGLSHAIYPFQVDGLWGAIGKSRNQNLTYQNPEYESFEELVFFNAKLYLGYQGLCQSREKDFLGLRGLVYDVNVRFTNFEEGDVILTEDFKIENCVYANIYLWGK